MFRTQLIIPEKRRRYDFDQNIRVLLSADLHSISVLMAQMETEPPDITNSCEVRNRLSLEIEAFDIVINRCTELVNFPDTDDNHEMKAILRASIDDTQRKKDTMYNFEAHSHHPIIATHEKSCACYPIGSCHRFPRPPSPAKEQNQADSKTR
ncbi:hypothetical protein TNCV_3996451 [Trichonephila clavipes]|nr:hypothetical protein TNCV_3996451 [Trichonephila clavipes]